MSPRPSTARRIVRLAGLVAAALVSPTLSFAEFVPGSWSGDFAIPAFDGQVSTCAIFDGRYVVGGDFRYAGETPTRNVAMWTGSEWVQPGAGLPSQVNALVERGGRLIAGIAFAPPGSAPVMEFDGLAWRPLGPELYGNVDALLVHGADLYAAGQLYLVGGANGYRVVRWNGSEWVPVGGLFDGRVLSLAMFRGDLHAGGGFIRAEDAFASRIAHWDGAHWTGVGGGTGAGGAVKVAALEVFQDRLIAGGFFDAMGGVATNNIAAWDGSVWAPLPNTPSDALIADLAVEGSILHVSGVLQVPGAWASGLAAFDGSTWTVAATYPSWGIEDVALAGGKLIAVGDHSDLRQGSGTIRIPSRDVVVRDGSWHDLPAWKPTMRGLLGPGHTMVESFAEFHGDLYAGGYFAYAADPPSWRETGGLARWDGSAWNSVGGPLRGYANELLEAGGRLITGGIDMTVGSVSSAVLAWDGATWDDLGDPLSGWVGGLTEWQGGIVAVGALERVAGGGHFAVGLKRGAAWEPLGASFFPEETYLNDVAVYRNDLYVAGDVPLIPTTGFRSLARWDGTAWSEVPGTPLTLLRTLLPRNDELWVGGTAYSIGSAVWRWDGAQWNAVGGLLGSVAHLIEVDGEIFVGGTFNAGGVQTTLARWDGTAWQAIAGAPEKQVRALAVMGNDLYVGGWFTRVGDLQAEGIARWSGFASLPREGLVRFAAPWPSPARERVTFRITLRNPGRVRLVLHDLRGAVVAIPIDETWPAGARERGWSLPHGIRAGVYFARLESPDGPAVTKVVIAP